MSRLSRSLVVLLVPVLASAVRADGVTALAAAQIASGPGAIAAGPECARAPGGEMIIAWETVLGGAHAVRWLVLDAQGAIASGPLALTLPPNVEARRPRVAATAASFLLVYELRDLGAPLVQADAHFLVFTTGGVHVNGGVASTGGAAAIHDDLEPACAGSRAGVFVIAWVRKPALGGPTAEVFARRFDTWGSPIDPIDVMASAICCNFGEQQGPAVCIWPSGRALVAWTDGPRNAPASAPSPDGHGQAVVGRWFDSAFAPSAGPAILTLVTARDQWGARLSADERSSAVLGFSADTSDTAIDAYTLRLTDTGQYLDTAQTNLSAADAGEQNIGEVAMNGAGEYVAAWRDAVVPPGQPSPRCGWGRFARYAGQFDAGLASSGLPIAGSVAGVSVVADAYANYSTVAALDTATGHAIVRRDWRRNMVVVGGSPIPGGYLTLSLSSPADPSWAYVLGVSLGQGPIAIDTRRLKLSWDALLQASVLGPPSFFVNFSGTLNASGAALAAVTLPTYPILSGLTFHFAFVTVDPFGIAPSGIDTVSDTTSFTMP